MLYATVFAALAYAHVTLNPNVFPGSYSKADVRVPHGCNKTATTEIVVTIPEGLSSVKAQPQDGWSLSYTMRALAVPIVGESGNITEEVAAVTWSGGNLPDNQFQDFGLSFKLPPSKDGTVFEFPVLQKCEVGETNWNESATDKSAKPRYPAAMLTVMKNGTLSLAETTVGSGAAKASSTAILVAILCLFI